MQISSVMYPSINAKLKGMYAQKLNNENLQELIKQNNTKQAVSLLKSLKDSFKTLEDDPRRINIKIVLDDILINDIQKIEGLLNSTDKEFFRQFISIYEIKCIKSVLRKLSSGSSVNEQTNEVQNWANKIFKKIVGIWEVNDYEQFLEYMEKTKYKKIFEKYGENVNLISLFEIENDLDCLYFESMIKKSKSYNRHLEDMIGKQIDLNNIVWIYRIKKNYDLAPEQIKNVLIKFEYKLKIEELECLIQSNSDKEIVEILNKTYYARFINFSDLNNLENQIDKYLYRVYQKYFRGNVFEMSSIYAYIQIMEMENNDIMNIVEGIRYNLKKEEISKKLVR